MPIYLKAPSLRRPDDGKGWNRLALVGGSNPCNDQCALKPRSYTTLWESQDTRRASYGGYGPCGHKGDCDTCPTLLAEPPRMRRMHPDEDRNLVRVLDGRPRLMVNPDTGRDPWDGWSYPWTWDELARLQGWRLGDRFVDRWGETFWLIRAEQDGGRTDGC